MVLLNIALWLLALICMLVLRDSIRAETRALTRSRRDADAWRRSLH
jgi:hypothetical protein